MAKMTNDEWRRRKTVARSSAVGFELGEQGLEGTDVFQALEVGVLGHPVVVGVAEFHGFAEGAEGVGTAFGKGEAAGEIVAGGGVVGLELDELAVHLEAVGDAAGLGVEAAEEFDHVLVAGLAAEDRFVEGDVEGGIFFAGHGPVKRGFCRRRFF